MTTENYVEEHHTAKKLKTEYASLWPVWEDHTDSKMIPTAEKNRKVFWAKTICGTRKRILLVKTFWEQ